MSTTIPYSEFNELLQRGEVHNLVVSESTIEGEYTDSVAGFQRFRSVRVDPEIVRLGYRHS